MQVDLLTALGGGGGGGGGGGSGNGRGGAAAVVGRAVLDVLEVRFRKSPTFLNNPVRLYLPRHMPLGGGPCCSTECSLSATLCEAGSAAGRRQCTRRERRRAPFRTPCPQVAIAAVRARAAQGLARSGSLTPATSGALSCAASQAAAAAAKP